MGFMQDRRWRYLRKRRVWIPTTLVVFVTVGYTAWWWATAFAFERLVASWAAQERDMGTAVAYRDLSMVGFPALLRAEVHDLSFVRPDGLAWYAPDLAAEAEPWTINTVDLFLPGIHRLVLPSGGTAPVEVRVQEGGGRVTLHVDGSLRRARINLGQLVLGPAAGGPRADSSEALTLERLVVEGGQPNGNKVDKGETSLAVSVRAEGVQLPAVVTVPFGSRIEQMTLSVHVVGALPRGATPAALLAWSKAGGTVEVDQLALAWGPLSIRAKGTWVLDDELQPAGTLNAEVTGAEATVDLLASQGVLDPDRVSLAKAAIAALTPRLNGETEGVLRAPVAVRNQAFWLGPFKVAPVPRIQWGPSYSRSSGNHDFALAARQPPKEPEAQRPGPWLGTIPLPDGTAGSAPGR